MLKWVMTEVQRNVVTLMLRTPSGPKLKTLELMLVENEQQRTVRFIHVCRYKQRQ